MVSVDFSGQLSVMGALGRRWLQDVIPRPTPALAPDAVTPAYKGTH